MAVPTYDQFIEPILRYLAAHPEGVRARDAHDAAADALGLTEADRSELLPSGAQLVYKNRAGWAHDRLKRAGLSQSPQRGWWRLTEQGFEFVNENAGPLSPETLEELARAFIHARLRTDAVGEDGGRYESRPVPYYPAHQFPPVEVRGIARLALTPEHSQFRKSVR